MTLAIDTADGRGLSNKVHHELLSNNIKVMLFLLFISHKEAFYHLFNTKKTEHFSYKSGHAVQVVKKTGL